MPTSYRVCAVWGCKQDKMKKHREKSIVGMLDELHSTHLADVTRAPGSAIRHPPHDLWAFRFNGPFSTPPCHIHTIFPPWGCEANISNPANEASSPGIIHLQTHENFNLFLAEVCFTPELQHACHQK